MSLKYIANGNSLVVDSDKCVGCKKCVEVCPHAVFAMIEGTNKASPIARENCMECGACAKNCPVSAISVESGVGCAMAVMNGLLRKGKPGCDSGCGCG